MKLLGIVITFHPNIEELRENINSYIGDVDSLIIWENTPSSEKQYQLTDFIQDSNKVISMGDGLNVGIGAALNKAAQYMLKEQFDFLILFDQDSCFEFGHLEKYIRYIRDGNFEDVGVFGANYHHCNTPVYKGSDSGSVIYVNECITSGSIIPRFVFERGMFFNENLFIDTVDFEFSYRLQKWLGLRTMVFSDIFLKHKLGYLSKYAFGLTSDNYSAFRTYYLIRNQIIMGIEYPSSFSNYRKYYLVVHYILKRLITVGLFEKDKSRKLKAIINGIWDGLFKRRKILGSNIISSNLKDQLT